MEFYNTSYFSVYNDLMNDEVFEDGETADEIEEIRLFAYRRDLGGIFQKDLQRHEFIDDLTEDILKVFSQCKQNSFFQKCLSLLKTKTIIDDDASIFILLFSYDYLYLTHFCLCEFFTNGDICQEYQEVLLERISMLS